MLSPALGLRVNSQSILALEVEVKETAFEEVEEHLYYLNVSEMGISSAENIESPAPLPILQ